MLKQLDIERSLFPDEFKSMELEGQQYFYIEQENTTAITRGLAILISDSGLSMVSKQGLAPLADELNQLGWATVLLSAPDTAFVPKINSTPETENSATQAVDTEDNPAASNLIHNKASQNSIAADVFNQHQEDLIALLKVGVKKAGEYPGYFLIIAQGTSAAWLTKIYAESKSNIPDAFIAVSPYWSDRQHNNELAKLMAKTPMPVLDVFSPRDNDWVLHSAPFRKNTAMKSLKLLYRQRELSAANSTSQQAYYLSREIHGWLTKMGW